MSSTHLAADYDPEAEEAGYGRALLPPADLAQLKADIAEHGFLTIDEVRSLVQQNTVKETQEARDETYAVDPELLLQIDTRTDFRVFIAGDNVYTRAELYAHFPFDAFRTTPEEVFVQQEVGVFPPRRWAEAGPAGAGGEYIARDVGERQEEFIMIEDLVGLAARRGYTERRAPTRIVKTKIYLGKGKWDDFSTMSRFMTAFSTFVAPLMPAGSPALALTGLFGGPGPLALQDASGAELERARAAQEREQAALRALEAKAAALRAKEAELRAREDALFRSLGLDPPSGAAAGPPEP